jgi:hypothetical protein
MMTKLLPWEQSDPLTLKDRPICTLCHLQAPDGSFPPGTALDAFFSLRQGGICQRMPAFLREVTRLEATGAKWWVMRSATDTRGASNGITPDDIRLLWTTAFCTAYLRERVASPRGSRWQGQLPISFGRIAAKGAAFVTTAAERISMRAENPAVTDHAVMAAAATQVLRDVKGREVKGAVRHHAQPLPGSRHLSTSEFTGARPPAASSAGIMSLGRGDGGGDGDNDDDNASDLGRGRFGSSGSGASFAGYAGYAGRGRGRGYTSAGTEDALSNMLAGPSPAPYIFGRETPTGNDDGDCTYNENDPPPGSFAARPPSLSDSDLSALARISTSAFSGPSQASASSASTAQQNQPPPVPNAATKPLESLARMRAASVAMGAELGRIGGARGGSVAQQHRGPGQGHGRQGGSATRAMVAAMGALELGAGDPADASANTNDNTAMHTTSSAAATSTAPKLRGHASRLMRPRANTSAGTGSATPPPPLPPRERRPTQFRVHKALLNKRLELGPEARARAMSLPPAPQKPE